MFFLGLNDYFDISKGESVTANNCFLTAHLHRQVHVQPRLNCISQRERKPGSVRPKPQPPTTGRKHDHFGATDPRRGKVGGQKREVRRRGRNTTRSLIRNAPRAKLVSRSLYVRQKQSLAKRTRSPFSALLIFMVLAQLLGPTQPKRNVTIKSIQPTFFMSFNSKT